MQSRPITNPHVEDLVDTLRRVEAHLTLYAHTDPGADGVRKAALKDVRRALAAAASTPTQPHVDLPNGDLLYLMVTEGPFGTPGNRLKIMSDGKPLVVLPSSANALEISTADALQRERENLQAAVASRKQSSA